MRKWVSVNALSYGKGASPDTPDIWSDVSGMWPNQSGSYTTSDRYGAAVSRTATGETTTAKYAFAAATPSGSIGYVIGTKIWEAAVSGASLTDRTNAVVIGSFPMMAQYGNVTICVMGNATATVSATAGNFAALAGAPKGEIPLVCSNAAIILNGDAGTLYTDGWFASNVGDYTNWTTGEAANGRLLSTSGPILAGVVFRDQVYAFKQGSIYRGRYVGGAVKWAWELVCPHIGLSNSDQISGTLKHAVVACRRGIAFISRSTTQTPGIEGGITVHFYDGANDPAPLNPSVYLDAITSSPILTYDPLTDMLVISGTNENDARYFYHFPSDAWGKAPAINVATIPVCGNSVERSRHYRSTTTTLPELWEVATNAFKLRVPDWAQNVAGSAYVVSSLYGNPTTKTNFKRVTPRLRRRVNVAGGTPSIALTPRAYLELHSIGTDGSGVTESSTRARFDFLLTNNFYSFKLVFTDMAVDVEDLVIQSTHAGTD